MSQGFLGEIRITGFSFAPKDWMFCHGQLLSILHNQALFTILGTTYGGDGVNTFSLPDLRGRVALGPGPGPGPTNFMLGEVAGTPTAWLLSSNIPSHTHPVLASADQPNNSPARTPQDSVLATPQSATYAAMGGFALMAPTALGATGGSVPHENMQPYLTLSFIICVAGIYPSQ